MRYAQGRVAVQLTATGTFKVEWQCASHCHSMVNVRDQYAQGRVAVQLVRSGSSGSAAHGNRYAQGRVAVPAETAPNS